MQPRPITDPAPGSAPFTFTQITDTEGLLSHPGQSPATLKGAQLVASFPVEGIGTLIVTDCDCPFEELVYIHLLDPALTLLDTATLGGAYTPGIVQGMDRIGPRTFRIRFPDAGTSHRIEVHAPRRLFLRPPTWLTVTQDA